jgi:hypothetical protein
MTNMTNYFNNLGLFGYYFCVKSVLDKALKALGVVGDKEGITEQKASISVTVYLLALVNGFLHRWLLEGFIQKQTRKLICLGLALL